MKIFKFIPAALAVIALASCSNDDLLVESNVAQDVKSAGNITIDPLVEDGVSTRQGNIPGGSVAPIWQGGDMLRTYEAKPTTYDKYEFNATSNCFEGIGGSTALDTDAKYALFPSKNVDYAGYRDGSVVAVVNIPQLIIYDEESEFEHSDEMAYVSNIPMWGTVESGNFPTVDMIKMYYLTSALRLNIKNAFAKGATFVKIETSDGQPISGAFEAALNTAEPKEAKLKKGTSALVTHNTMYVDLRNAPSYLTNIYLPIVADAYEWLKVSVTSVDGTTATALEANSDQIISDLETGVSNTGDKATGWQTIRTYYNSTPFVKGSFKVLKSQTQYDLAGVTTCEMLSKALQQYAKYDIEDENETSVVLEIGGAQGLNITREGDVDDYTIFVPEMNVKDVTIKIPRGINVAYANAKLVVKDKDIKNTFNNGKVTIIVGDGSTDAVKSKNLGFEVNLPETSLTLAGKFDGVKDLTTIDIKNVKDFSIGDGLVTTSIAKNPATTIKVGAATSVTVATNATCNTPLDVTETKNIETVAVYGTQLNDIEAYQADVYVLGTATTVWQYHSKATTYIGNDGSADARANGKVENIYTVGDVYIANKEESEAVSGVITPLANNTITLKNGYVKAINYAKNGKFATTSSPYYVKGLNELTSADLLDKHIKLNLNEICGNGQTAIATIDDDLLEYTVGGVTYNFLEMTESKWGGYVINATNFPAYVTSSALHKVYTASELASESNNKTENILLYNDFDLDNKAWSCPTLNVVGNPYGIVDGKDPREALADAHKDRINGDADKVHNVSNMKLDNVTASSLGNVKQNATVNFGLFGNTTLSAIIRNINIKTVASDLQIVSGTVPSQIGAVIGSVNVGEFTVSNVNVTQASLGGDLTEGSGPSIVGVQKVGGIIGYVGTTNTTLNISDAKVGGTLTGQGYLGGAVGQYEGTGNTKLNGSVNIKSSTFDQNFTVKPQLGSDDYANYVYGTVGMMIGQVNSASAEKINLNPVNGATDNITDRREDLGFKCNFQTKMVGTALIKYGFYGGNQYVGYSPDFKDSELIVTVNGVQTKYLKDLTYNPTKVDFNNLSASKKQNAYIQWGNWAE